MAATEHAAGEAQRTRQHTEREEPSPAGAASGRIRGELEHHRPRHAARDPFAVDAARALEALRDKWGDSYRVTACQGGYEAVRRHGARVSLTAEIPDDLDRAMTDDSRAW